MSYSDDGDVAVAVGRGCDAMVRAEKKAAAAVTLLSMPLSIDGLTPWLMDFPRPKHVFGPDDGGGLRGPKVGVGVTWGDQSGGRFGGGLGLRSQHLIDFPLRRLRGILTGWDVPHFATIAKRHPQRRRRRRRRLIIFSSCFVEMPPARCAAVVLRPPSALR